MSKTEKVYVQDQKGIRYVSMDHAASLLASELRRVAGAYGSVVMSPESALTVADALDHVRAKATSYQIRFEGMEQAQLAAALDEIAAMTLWQRIKFTLFSHGVVF